MIEGHWHGPFAIINYRVSIIIKCKPLCQCLGQLCQGALLVRKFSRFLFAGNGMVLVGARTKNSARPRQLWVTKTSRLGGSVPEADVASIIFALPETSRPR